MQKLMGRVQNAVSVKDVEQRFDVWKHLWRAMRVHASKQHTDMTMTITVTVNTADEMRPEGVRARQSFTFQDVDDDRVFNLYIEKAVEELAGFVVMAFSFEIQQLRAKYGH